MPGLEEIDRAASPIVSREAHEQINAGLFARRTAAVVGRESAADAVARFDAAIARALAAVAADGNLVVIAHGTVIALFVEQHTGRDAFGLWRSLGCGDFVALPVGHRIEVGMVIHLVSP
jgi:broad specificity phosphatase PhoE